MFNVSLDLLLTGFQLLFECKVVISVLAYFSLSTCNRPKQTLMV